MRALIAFGAAAVSASVLVCSEIMEVALESPSPSKGSPSGRSSRRRELICISRLQSPDDVQPTLKTSPRSKKVQDAGLNTS